MRTRRRITRTTLAELWRTLLAILEGLEVEDAPALARSLAISGLTGRIVDRATGVRIDRDGDDYLITSPMPEDARPRKRVAVGC